MINWPFHNLFIHEFALKERFIWKFKITVDFILGSDLLLLLDKPYLIALMPCNW